MAWKGQGKPAACLLPWRHGADVGEKGAFSLLLTQTEKADHLADNEFFLGA